MVRPVGRAGREYVAQRLSADFPSSLFSFIFNGLGQEQSALWLWMDLADGYGITRYALFLLSPLLSCTVFSVWLHFMSRRTSLNERPRLVDSYFRTLHSSSLRCPQSATCLLSQCTTTKLPRTYRQIIVSCLPVCKTLSPLSSSSRRSSRTRRLWICTMFLIYYISPQR